jgi:hypothetical protein
VLEAGGYLDLPGFDARKAQEQLIHRWNGGHHARLMLLYGLKQALGAVLGHEHQAGAVVHGDHHGVGQAVYVVEGQYAYDPVFMGEFQKGLHYGSALEMEIPVGNHGALGIARGAGGVNEHRRIVGIRTSAALNLLEALEVSSLNWMVPTALAPLRPCLASLATVIFWAEASSFSTPTSAPAMMPRSLLRWMISVSGTMVVDSWYFPAIRPSATDAP